MATREELCADLAKGIELAISEDNTEEKMIIAVLMTTLSVQLDIRDLLEGIDRRLGAQSITRAVKKKKK